MADIVYNMDGQSTGVVRAWQAVNTSIEEMLRTVGDITPASVKAEAAQKSLGATAERWLKQMRTPLDDHLKRMQELQQLLQAGNITQHEYSKGIALSVAEMKRAEEASDTYGAAAKAVLAELVTPQERHNARLTQLNELRGLNKLTEDQYAAAVARANEQLAKEDTTLQSLLADGAKLRASLVTPQDEYAAALKRSNQLLAAGEISEAEYAAAVDLAKKNLDAQDQSLQAALRDAAKIKTLAVTPQEAYAKAIKNADDLLKKNLITKKEYNAELAHQEQLLKKAEAGESSFFATALGSSGQVLATITGVGTVIGGLALVVAQLKAEYDNLVQRQKTAADRQIDTAAAQHQAIAALGDDPTMNADQLTKHALDTSLSTGVIPKTIFDAQANAISAKAALSAQEALDAVSVAADANPYTGIAETAGSLLDLKNRFGGGDPLKNITMAQLMGVSIGGQQASRVKDPTAYATNAIPAITQLGAFKDTLQNSTALVAAFSTSMNDLTGASSGTAAIKLAKQLEIALPKLGTTMERIQYVQSPQGDALRKKFFSPGPGKMDIESGAYKSVQELLSPGDNKTKANLDAALKSVPSLDNAEAVYRKVSANQKAQEIQKVARLDRQYKVEAEAAQLADAAGAAASVNREGLIKFLTAMKASDIEQKFALAEFEFGTSLGEQDPLGFAIEKLKSKARIAAGDKTEFRNVGRDVMGFSGEAVLRPATAEEQEKSRQYSGAASRLERLQNARNGGAAPAVAEVPPVVKALDKVAQALEKNTKVTEQNTVKPPVVVKNQKPISQPTKTPKSAALAAPGGR